MKLLSVQTSVAFILLAATLAEAQTTHYSLRTPEHLPIPKKDFFALWREVALRDCEDARQKKNLSPEQCREKVQQRSAVCAAKAGIEAPDYISSKIVSRELGREYLDCVTPYYFCKGVEVKTLEEVRQICGADASKTEGGNALPLGYIKQGNLVWSPKLAYYPYLKAKELCDGILNGTGGWRLPFRHELLALHESGLAKVAKWGSGHFWSTTRDKKEWHYFTVSLSNGRVTSMFHPNVAEVTCVHTR